MKIDIYNKDTCLEIAKVVNKVIDDESFLLNYIPDYLFGLKVDIENFADGDFKVKGILADDAYKVYSIPPYFVRNVFEEVKHDKHR